MSASQQDILLRLFDGLLLSYGNLDRSKKTEAPSSLLFGINSLNRNKKSRIFSESAMWMTPETSASLLDQGLVQRIISEGKESYSLTFKGIALCIRNRLGSTFEDQFLEFLQLADQEFATNEQTGLNWREKLASLSLILMASTSEKSAIMLDNAANKPVLREVFEKTLLCLKEHGIIKKDAKLPVTRRGETPESALMSRINSLPRKVRFYYNFISGGSSYYFSIEKDRRLENDKLQYLLGRVFEPFNREIAYPELNKELTDISVTYSHRFLGRIVNPVVSREILRGMKTFMDNDVWRLPQCSSTSHAEGSRERTGQIRTALQ